MNTQRTVALWGAAALLAGFGAGLGARALAQQPPAPQMAPMREGGAADGRFRLVIGPTTPADTYLVDTQTGATWQRMDDPKTHEAYFGAVRVQPGQPPVPMPGTMPLR